MSRIAMSSISLVRKMNTSTKLIVMCVLFIVPLVFAVYSVVAEKNIAIDFADKERVGNQYISAIRPLLAAIIGHERGDAASAGQLGGASAVLEKSANSFGEGMEAAQQSKDMVDAIDKVSRVSDADFAVHDAAASATLALISRVGDSSNLTLDPDLDSYYVQDAVVGKYPTLLSQLMSAREVARNLAKNAAMKTDDRVSALLLIGALNSTIDGVKTDVTQAIRGNTDGGTKSALEAPYQSAIAATGRYVDGIGNALKDQGGKKLDLAAMDKQYDDAIKSTTVLWENSAVELERLLKRRVDGFMGKLWFTLMVCVSLGLLSIGAAILVWFNIVRPLVRLETVVKQVKETENYDLRVEDSGTDEVGRLAAAFNDMLAETKLNRERRMEEEQRAQTERVAREEAERKAKEAHRAEIERREREAANVRRVEMLNLADRLEASVREIIVSVSGAGTQMRATAEGLSSTSSEASGRLSAVAAASEEASANVQTVATAAEELSSSVAEIGRQMNESTRIAGKAVAEAERTNDTVKSLADAAQKIGEVISLINDIAAQTNLLALNATIEAARAGEAGKGFAVVAAEVKGLANQTSKATEEITTQINQVRAVTEATVTAIKEIGETIRQVSEIATAIASAVEEQGAATQEIARNVQQAAAGTHDVSTNVVTVTESVQRSDKMAAQVLAAANALSGQSERLRTEVDRFVGEIRSAG